VKVVKPTGGPVQEYEVWLYQAGGFYYLQLFICRLHLPANLYAPFDGDFLPGYVLDAESRRTFRMFIEFYNSNGPIITVFDFPYPPGQDVLDIRCPVTPCKVRAGQLVAILGPSLVLPLRVLVQRASVDDAIRYLELIFR
jgi:hypothetical protein